MRYTGIIAFLLIFSLLHGCVDPFEFQGVDTDKRIVVDGFITNAQKAHKISVSRTTGFSNTKNELISGCQIVIRDSEGNVEVLTENPDGHYYTSHDFRAELGLDYQLEVRTPDEQILTSAQVRMNQGRVMRDFEFQPVIRRTVRYSDGEVIENETLDFSITIDRGEEEVFYKWNLHPYFVFQAYNVLPGRDEWCWINVWLSDGVSIYHDDPTRGGAMEESILVGTENYNFKLEHEYRLTVEQLTIDKGAYEFWSAVRQQSENTGSVFDPLPISPAGNITNDSNPEEPIIGYFGAYKADSLVMTINHESVEGFEPLVQYNCDPDPRGRRPLGCWDCTLLGWGQGSVPYKPEWW